eukprot:364760-Chlamydomonas_euryale.AAC.6
MPVRPSRQRANSCGSALHVSFRPLVPVSTKIPLPCFSAKKRKKSRHVSSNWTLHVGMGTGVGRGGVEGGRKPEARVLRGRLEAAKKVKAK